MDPNLKFFRVVNGVTFPMVHQEAMTPGQVLLAFENSLASIDMRTRIDPIEATLDLSQLQQ